MSARPKDKRHATQGLPKPFFSVHLHHCLSPLLSSQTVAEINSCVFSHEFHKLTPPLMRSSPTENKNHVTKSPLPRKKHLAKSPTVWIAPCRAPLLHRKQKNHVIKPPLSQKNIWPMPPSFGSPHVVPPI